MYLVRPLLIDCHERNGLKVIDLVAYCLFLYISRERRNERTTVGSSSIGHFLLRSFNDIAEAPDD